MDERDELDESLLLDLLNTTPMVDGEQRDELGQEAAGRRWLAAHGQPATRDEWRVARRARDTLQGIVRTGGPAASLGELLGGVTYRPELRRGALEWRLDVPAGRVTAVRAVLAWDGLRRTAAGRLRPCANPDCRLFLIDHSKPNRARWCSMAVCGNRMKARRHYERTRQGAGE